MAMSKYFKTREEYEQVSKEIAKLDRMKDKLGRFVYHPIHKDTVKHPEGALITFYYWKEEWKNVDFMENGGYIDRYPIVLAQGIVPNL